jgi:hypothetical protein
MKVARDTVTSAAVLEARLRVGERVGIEVSYTSYIYVV